jgi:putative transposase
MADITGVDLARRVGEHPQQRARICRGRAADIRSGLIGAEADAICGAPYGQVSEEPVNYRSGYRERRWDTRAGSIEPAIPSCAEAATSPTGC